MASGGGSDKAKTTSTELEPSPIVVEEPVQSTGFSDITVSDTFNWSMQSQANQSATLLVRAWDVDSEATHGQNGEYDGIAVDGIDLYPSLLQGINNTWSETF
jgi:hypothetical protein